MSHPLTYPRIYPSSELVIDPVLIRTYDVSGPRYTSYPTADRFVEAFGESELRQWLAKRNIGGISQPLSASVHLPFCGTGSHRQSSKCIKYLKKEWALLAPHLGAERRLGELHWGAGLPAFLSHEEMAALMAALAAHFERAENAEYSIDVEPRRAAPGTLPFLASLGFNRVSFGMQSEEATRRAIDEARAAGFRSVGLELSYGLPKQTLDGFSRTLDTLIALDPDRVALRSYAHLPSGETKLAILTLAVGRLARAGYLYIGMDHFARPEDELAVAQRQGRLQRSFQGYSTHPESDLLSFGPAAIGRVGPCYYQNAKRLDEYYARLDDGRLPIARGIELNADDLARRAVIQALSCHFRVSLESIELAYLVDFRRYFAEELKDLRRLEAQGLVELSPEWIVVTPRGRLLVRAICMVFDRYLRARQVRAACSKVI